MKFLIERGIKFSLVTHFYLISCIVAERRGEISFCLLIATFDSLSLFIQETATSRRKIKHSYGDFLYLYTFFHSPRGGGRPVRSQYPRLIADRRRRLVLGRWRRFRYARTGYIVPLLTRTRHIRRNPRALRPLQRWRIKLLQGQFRHLDALQSFLLTANVVALETGHLVRGLALLVTQSAWFKGFGIVTTAALSGRTAATSCFRKFLLLLLFPCLASIPLMINTSENKNIQQQQETSHRYCYC